MVVTNELELETVQICTLLIVLGNAVRTCLKLTLAFLKLFNYLTVRLLTLLVAGRQAPSICFQ
jgi:hypothetical protein